MVIAITILSCLLALSVLITVLVILLTREDRKDLAARNESLTRYRTENANLTTEIGLLRHEFHHWKSSMKELVADMLKNYANTRRFSSQEDIPESLKRFTDLE